MFNFNVLEHGSGIIIQGENITGEILGNTCNVLNITNFGNGLSSITLSEDLFDSNLLSNVYVIGEKITGSNSGSTAYVKDIPTFKTLDVSNTKIATVITTNPKSNTLSDAEKLASKLLNEGHTLQFVDIS